MSKAWVYFLLGVNSLFAGINLRFIYEGSWASVIPLTLSGVAIWACVAMLKGRQR